jgi:glycyl-tRNA synthetase beta chain
MLKDLVLELYSEEIPAQMQLPAAKAFKEIFSKNFSIANIIFENIDAYVSPCRIIIHCKNLSPIVAAQITEKRGPKTSAPEAAIKAFCDSCKKQPSELEVRNVKDADYYFDIQTIPAQKVENILPDIIVKSIPEYVWPKSMYWGEYQISWVRPLRNILCLLDDQVLSLKYGHLESNNITFGHKFMSEGAIQVKDINDYFKQLDLNKVVYDQEIRKEKIIKQLEAKAAEFQVELDLDEDLLDEVNGLVEYPVVMVGAINKRFLKVPPEVLTCSMKKNQRYFTAYDKQDNLTPLFFFVANMSSRDEANIIDGNERVLTARLSDAEFFYREDLKISSEERFKKLETVIFHAKLGNMKQKTERIIEMLSRVIQGDGLNRLQVAAKYCKADLVSGVVGEFPELQGIIGGYYVSYEGMSEMIACAISEHYRPFGANDELPEEDAAAILSVNDKIDSLVGLYVAGERATGSKDPYALRRYAIGIIRVSMKFKSYYLIKTLVAHSIELHGGTENDRIEILAFIKERIRHYLIAIGYDQKVVNALTWDFGTSNPELGDFQKRIDVLQNFVKNPKKSEKVLEIYKRASNILKQNHMIDLSDASEQYDEEEEKLSTVISLSSLILVSSLLNSSYEEYCAGLQALVAPVERFFEKCMIVTDDIETTKRRLSLLKKLLKHSFDPYANFDEL